ncbi:hypothetical protein HK100_006241 [Physocladia obscura]|uniref:Uncharacterized protein n=1 Tax=Physocladia obscura TaxID=109957 RepID=A0AAD5TB86_9FUNG|nr:hypothetical protein HK100_006241 [Physocladia obscura]
MVYNCFGPLGALVEVESQDGTATMAPGNDVMVYWDCLGIHDGKNTRFGVVVDRFPLVHGKETLVLHYSQNTCFDAEFTWRPTTMDVIPPRMVETMVQKIKQLENI